VAVSDPGLDDLLAVLVPLNVTDGTGVESRQSEAEAEATVPGEQRHFGGMYIHVTFLSPHQLRVHRIQVCRPDQAPANTALFRPGPTLRVVGILLILQMPALAKTTTGNLDPGVFAPHCIFSMRYRF